MTIILKVMLLGVKLGSITANKWFQYGAKYPKMSPMCIKFPSSNSFLFWKYLVMMCPSFYEQGLAQHVHFYR